MWAGCRAIWSLLIGLFRSRATLEAENLVLRQQILVLRRTAPKRLSFNALDRLILVGLYRLFPDVRSALAIVRPETVVRWHRAGFRAYWRWKSRPRSGRPKVPFEIRQLIRDMSLANPLWGAPRIRRRSCRRMSRPYRSRNEIVGTTNRSTRQRRPHGCAETCSSPATVSASSVPCTWPRSSARYRCRA